MKLEEIKVSVAIYHQQSHILPFEFLIPALAVLETLTFSSFNPLKKREVCPSLQQIKSPTLQRTELTRFLLILLPGHNQYFLVPTFRCHEIRKDPFTKSGVNSSSKRLIYAHYNDRSKILA